MERNWRRTACRSGGRLTRWARKLGRGWCLAAVALIVLNAHHRGARADACAGDCNGDGVVQIEEVDLLPISLQECFTKGHLRPPATTFGGALATCMIHQGLAHQVGCGREELGSVSPIQF